MNARVGSVNYLTLIARCLLPRGTAVAPRWPGLAAGVATVHHIAEARAIAGYLTMAVFS